MATTPSKPAAKADEPKSDQKFESAVGVRLPSVQPGPAADALADDEAVAATQKAISAKLQTEWDAGVRGTPVDPTPNYNYTLAGVTDDSVHTPEEFKIRTGTIVYPTVHPDAAK